MNWIYTKDRTPITYKEGHWDGKNSDQVLAETKDGTRYLATYCEGFLDVEYFEWYELCEDCGFEVFEDGCRNCVDTRN